MTRLPADTRIGSSPRAYVTSGSTTEGTPKGLLLTITKEINVVNTGRTSCVRT